MKILITGGNGYIAKNIKLLLHGHYDIDVITRQHLDLTNKQQVDEYFKQHQYDIVIHTAIAGGSRLKQDTPDIVYTNTLMLYNILSNRSYYKRFINLGSGAELVYPTTPYGMSKSIIANTIKDLNEHYNLRIFAIFNENELETRFIKSCITNYINKKPINIHQNKYMDFFSMDDFIKVLKLYIEADELSLDKCFDCCYKQKNTLLDIANIINNQDVYKVDINIIDTKIGRDYTGNAITRYDLSYNGIKNSIKKMHNMLKNSSCTL